MCIFFSVNLLAFVQPWTNQSNSSATPRQNTRFVVSNGKTAVTEKTWLKKCLSTWFTFHTITNFVSYHCTFLQLNLTGYFPSHSIWKQEAYDHCSPNYTAIKKKQPCGWISMYFQQTIQSGPFLRYFKIPRSVCIKSQDLLFTDTVLAHMIVLQVRTANTEVQWIHLHQSLKQVCIRDFCNHLVWSTSKHVYWIDNWSM